MAIKYDFLIGHGIAGREVVNARRLATLFQEPYEKVLLLKYSPKNSYNLLKVLHS